MSSQLSGTQTARTNLIWCERPNLKSQYKRYVAVQNQQIVDWQSLSVFCLLSGAFKPSPDSISQLQSRWALVCQDGPTYQVKSSLLYCQFFHMYSTLHTENWNCVLSDPWCIQLTLNTDSRRTNTDKYSLTICTYKLYRYTNEDIVEK